MIACFTRSHAGASSASLAPWISRAKGGKQSIIRGSFASIIALSPSSTSKHKKRGEDYYRVPLYMMIICAPSSHLHEARARASCCCCCCKKEGRIFLLQPVRRQLDCDTLIHEGRSRSFVRLKRASTIILDTYTLIVKSRVLHKLLSSPMYNIIHQIMEE